MLRALCIALFIAAFSWGQIDQGSIIGAVRDSVGGAIPKATVIVTNKATGVTRTSTTNETGEYQFPALAPGVYSVKASAPGFGSQVENDIEIHLQSRSSVDFDLKVGDVAQVLEVQSAPPLLQTETADVGGVVQQQQIKDLPLNGRRYSDLALLEAGTQKNLTNQNNMAPDRGWATPTIATR